VNDKANSSSPAPAVEVTAESPTTPGGSAQDKKIRGLLKKIRAIDELKMRLAGGEKLEDTQMKKIQTEESVRKELDALDFDE
jgi:translation initiation factor 2A